MPLDKLVVDKLVVDKLAPTNQGVGLVKRKREKNQIEYPLLFMMTQYLPNNVAELSTGEKDMTVDCTKSTHI